MSSKMMVRYFIYLLFINFCNIMHLNNNYHLLTIIISIIVVFITLLLLPSLS